MYQSPRIIVSIECTTENAAIQLVEQLNPAQCRLKVGKEMFTLFGPKFIEKLTKLGFSIFLDLKFHDIPNTVAGACRAAADLGVWMIDVHAQGGRRMLLAAREAIDKAGNRPLLVAITTLTSLEQADLAEIGIEELLPRYVLRLASLAQACGLDGVVCSGHEASAIRLHCGESFTLVTPGIRPENTAFQDQKRVLTPQQAIISGADYLVIGRPITQSANPAETLASIAASIGEK